jgi:hypothetical protein
VQVEEIFDCSSPSSTKYFFSSPYTISIHLSPLPGKLHGQAVVLGSLSLSMCLWFLLRVANHEDSIARHVSIQPLGRSSFCVELADSNSDPAIINTYNRDSVILEQTLHKCLLGCTTKRLSFHGF